MILCRINVAYQLCRGRRWIACWLAKGAETDVEIWLLLKRALWNKLTNEKAVRSQVASADWSSWLAG